MRPRTLRGRLVAGVLVLLALACAAVGVATSLALERSLLDRMDQQLSMTVGKFAASLEHHIENGDLGDSRGQSPGTLGVRLMGGQVTDAAVVVASGNSRISFPAADASCLARVPLDGRAHTVDLSALGDYRVIAIAGADGDVLINGLPLAGDNATVHRLQIIESVVFAAVMLGTGVAATIWVRLSLRPLQRVAGTARRVTELPLASGAVELPAPVPDDDVRSEIGQVGAAFNRMLFHVGDALARRHASEQRMRTFAADASHELRTPLATVRAHVELARRDTGPMPPRVEHALERIDAESLRMGALVDDLLLLARLDEGRPLARDEVDLSRVVIDATGDMHVSAPDHRWRLELPEEPVTVVGDADRLHQVVANLMGNARAHTPPGTTVTVTITTDVATVSGSSAAALTIADDGPGIPDELQGEIFERFVRADKARSRASGGSGLGLAIVRAVVGAHNGTVDMDSRPGRTVFRVMLPR
ncbi:sensor histidine kinase [Planotetraspora silvatica]|uniref:histidine kinase n=1 Tax=Planotetraspora silvatica TaxID=234614 RepID=A0A8J3UQS9_9ACTN|nr:HAMP domain-containing sensor histidine kinase [Planotetraspora silvatica]GII49060.1 sensor histidine kinase [Planotetraspora silvatica]